MKRIPKIHESLLVCIYWSCLCTLAVRKRICFTADQSFPLSLLQAVACNEVLTIHSSLLSQGDYVLLYTVILSMQLFKTNMLPLCALLPTPLILTLLQHREEVWSGKTQLNHGLDERLCVCVGGGRQLLPTWTTPELVTVILIPLSRGSTSYIQ